MNNRFKKNSDVVYQIKLVDLLRVFPEFKKDVPAYIDLNDFDYVVRFRPDCDYIEFGYESDFWVLKDNVYKVDLLSV